jgi:hypothetical protein
MRVSKLSAAVLAAVAIAVLAGCGHKLVARGDDHTVKLYPNEATYMKIKGLKKEGGPMAMLGGMGESMATREVDNNTPVRIISTDDQGAMVEVTDGPNKGVQGFAAKENVS